MLDSIKNPLLAMAEVLPGIPITPAQERSAYTTGDAVVVRCGLGIYQTVTGLGHGFFLEREAMYLVIADEESKALISG